MSQPAAAQRLNAASQAGGNHAKSIHASRMPPRYRAQNGLATAAVPHYNY